MEWGRVANITIRWGYKDVIEVIFGHDGITLDKQSAQEILWYVDTNSSDSTGITYDTIISAYECWKLEHESIELEKEEQ